MTVVVYTRFTGQGSPGPEGQCGEAQGPWALCPLCGSPWDPVHWAVHVGALLCLGVAQLSLGVEVW